MTSNEDHNTSDTNNNPINESSYHLKLVSFEDSQIDHFIPYSSPSILYWQTNKKFCRNFISNTTDIENKRANSSNPDLSTSKIEQIPEDTQDFQTEKKKIEIDHANSDQKLNPSKLVPQSSKSDLASLEISNLIPKPLNKSINLSSLEINCQKKLEFLDISEHETAKSQKPSQDNTGEILLELSCESENDQTQVSVKNCEGSVCQSTFDSELNYYKLIDIKLDEMRQKKLELLKKSDSPKPKINPVSWKISASPTLGEKENVSESKSCEISTQTSFVEARNRKKVLDESKKSPLGHLRFDMVQQKKFKTMIEAQKHEKKYKELELLAKIERLQAQRLKKLIMENTADDTSLMDNSYFHSTDLGEDSVDSTKLEKFVKKYEEKDRRKSELVRSTFSKNIEDWSLISECDSVLSNSNSMRLSLNLKRSQVEVVDLNDASVYKQPEGIRIIKENQIRKVSSDNKQLRSNFSTKREYFCDLSNRLKTVHSEPALKQNDNSFSSMSLQDAFLIFKKDLIERSNKRLRNIEERAQMRKLQAEYDQKQVQMNLKLKEVQRKFQVNSKPKVEIPCKRAMSSQEIRILTKKNYEKLPEVRQKQHKERLEQTRKLNLVKSSIYKKTIQQHVLSKGPNFGLNFKALKN
ncbi:hypothetical protein BpHYR1_014906 [Brachionus plicatilis]|uniref:ALMS motif domain-containing protein n=1 Tax=Brachionus plicatilis TaxID=10195 RepID=A0A3M7R959_BRAPC|nr:hypothetical protein BpHYR1_014906 [Brachionus plicatilis]